MNRNKLFLEDFFDPSFSLIAIYCSEAGYRMAYLLNSHLGTRFQRRAKDLDLYQKGKVITFPHFEYYNEEEQTEFHLLGNRFGQSAEKGGEFSGSLFPQNGQVYYLIPELKKADFLLKIEGDEDFVTSELIAQIVEIKQVVSAFAVDKENIKNINNLIFD